MIDTTTTTVEETTTIEMVAVTETDVITWEEETEETTEDTTTITTIIEEGMIEVDPDLIRDMVIKVDSHSIQTHQIKWKHRLLSIRFSKTKSFSKWGFLIYLLLCCRISRFNIDFNSSIHSLNKCNLSKT